jgi:hypothetical protein
MKKILIVTISTLAFFTCCTQPKNDVDTLARYNKNVVVAKQFIEAFSTKDSTKEASLLSEDYVAFGPGIGQDSLSKEVIIKGDKGWMNTFSEIKLTNAEYSPGLDANFKISPDVRLYGTWVFKFAKSGKISKMKFYSEFKINEEGKIYFYKEYCELHDMLKELDN